MTKIAIIYITYDGIVNSMCGVGVISRTFIECFPEVREFFSHHDLDLSLHLITPALNRSALGYSDEITNRSFEIAKKTGGGVHRIVNGTNGSEQFGGVSNWHIVSSSAASKALEISQDYDRAIVYCLDTPFMHVPYFIDLQKNAYEKQDIVSVLTLHSDVLSHHPENIDMERLAWEASAIKYCSIKESIKIAATSRFLINHLARQYLIPDDKIIPLQSGLHVNGDRYRQNDDSEIVRVLKEYNIPLEKDLVFSVGRAVSYKGFEILIKAFSQIKTENAHLVFIASPYLYAPSNINEIERLLSEYKISATPILNLDFKLPRYICQWKKTKIVAQLSIHEPFGLVPEEVRLWGQKQGPIVLTSKREGFIEQINDGYDGFFTDIDDTKEVASKIDYLLGLDDQAKQVLRTNGLQKVLKDYDYRLSIFKSISKLLGIDSDLLNQFSNSLSYENIY